MRQEEGRKHQALDSHELDQNVQTRSRGVLERVADRVPDNGSLVRVGTLAAEAPGVLL